MYARAGTPSGRVPPEALGISTGRTGGGKYVPDDIRFEQFWGREIDFATGRVVLHALRRDGGAVCGRRDEHLTPIDQPWDASYLPYLPRCRSCLTAGRPGGLPPGGSGQDSPGWLAPGVAASGVDVRTAFGTDEEMAGATGLRRVRTEHDLRRWMFTDLVIVDESIRGGFGHLLTISPRLLAGRPARIGQPGSTASASSHRLLQRRLLSAHTAQNAA